MITPQGLGIDTTDIGNVSFAFLGDTAQTLYAIQPAGRRLA